MGHVISRNGIAVNPKKMTVIESWPLPANPKALWGFLELTRYYRKFVKGYGGITVPLNRMLKKREFKWTDGAKDAFASLKRALLTPPTLRMPDFEKGFTLESDASGWGLGAVLMQEGHTVAYWRPSLKRRALMLFTYKKEMMTTILAVKKWRQYLLGRSFNIKTNQTSLNICLTEGISTPMTPKAQRVRLW